VSTGAGWLALRDELLRWRDAGLVADFWWRDDDATHPTAALQQLLALSAAADVPLIIGSNSGEDSLMGPKVADPAAALARIPAFAQAPYADQPDDETRLRAMFTDRYMGAPARWTASRCT